METERKEDLISYADTQPPEGKGSRDWLEWETISKEKVADCKIFSVSKTLAKSKAGADKIGRFFTLSCGPWVNIIAITDQKQLVMVEQYRHGIESLTLEIPGGSIDDTDIEPLDAAVRELKEETGFVADRWSLLGENHPNPALQGNVCYTYLAEDARWTEEPKFDSTGTERINTRFVHLSDIGSLVQDGTISHALVIVAFHFLTLCRPELIAADCS